MKHYVILHRQWKFIPMIALWFEKFEYEKSFNTTVTVLDFWIPFFQITWSVECTPITQEVKDLLDQHDELYKKQN